MADTRRWQGYSVDDLRALEKPEWLIHDVLLKSATTLMYAKSGVGKSFIGLDMALSVATGHGWHGYPVDNSGLVIYVALEQPRGYGARVKVWEQHTGHLVECHQFYLISGVVDLQSDIDVGAFIAHLQKTYGTRTVQLVVFDTLSRCMPKCLDENSNAEMARAAAGAERVARELDAGVMLVHHTGRTGKTPRGGSALDGNLDARIWVDPGKAEELTPGGTITLINKKQKDFELFPPVTLRAELVPLDDGGSSLVLVDEAQARPSHAPRTGRTGRSRTRQSRAQHDEKRRKALDMLKGGKPPAEVARTLKMNPNTVRSFWSRELKRAETFAA